MTSKGEQENHGRIARQREADYIANFRRQFHHGVTIAHPTTAEMIRLTDWSVVEQMEDDLLHLGHYLQVTNLSIAQQWHYPINVRIRYWIEPWSLGILLRRYPKQCFVIECATHSRLERFVTVGHDEESLGVATVEQLLQERWSIVQRWSVRYGTSVAYVVGLASTTGWDEESIGYIQDFAAHAGLLPYLVDLAALKVYGSTPHPQNGQYEELFELPLGDKKVNQITNQIQDYLLATGASRFTDLQTQFTCSHGLLRTACTRLAQNNPDYRILQEGANLIIRTD
jgi:hypothetical protein